MVGGKKNLLRSIITLIAFFALFACIRMYKYYTLCKNDAKSKKSKNSTASTEVKINYNKFIIHAIILALFVTFGTEIFNHVASNDFLQLIPIVGEALTIWSSLNKGVQYALTFTTAHLILNLSENNQNNIDNICY